jgi:hypothetical protein
MSDKYPWLPELDWDAIEKGRTFTIKELEQITGVPHRLAEHVTRRNIFVMALQVELEARGKPYTICERKGTVAVLTDSEASVHNHKWSIKYEKRIRNRNRLLQAVDATQLTEAERRRHERALICDGAVITSMAQTRREIRAEVRRRDRPGVEVWEALQGA